MSSGLSDILLSMEISTRIITEWLYTVGPRIVLIIVLAWVLQRFGMMIMERFIRQAIKPDQFALPSDEKQREDTLIAILRTVLNVLWVVIAIMLILDEIGLSIGPLLASAGIVGVALGFGGQWLIRDLISGLFIVIENQFRVGDIVTLHIGASGMQEISGRVEDMSPRLTVLRDLDGKVHHVPNGSITVATNVSMEFAGINLDIGIDQKVKLESAIKIINDIGQSLSEDKEWQDKILEAPQFLRVDDFSDKSVIIKITGKTLPMEQWAVSGELRKRLKLSFDKAGISLFASNGK